MFFKRNDRSIFINKDTIFKRKALDSIIMVLCGGVLIFSLYMIFSICFDYYKNEQLNMFLRQETYKNVGSKVLIGMQHKNQFKNSFNKINENNRQVLPKFKPLLEINKEVVGWINIPDTHIDYPVLQAGDNEYYLNHDINGNKSLFGSIFMDFRNNINGSDSNIILYGHNMKNGSMFHDLVYYKDQQFFEKHPIIFFDTLYEEEKWEIFSVYVTNVKFNYLITNFKTVEEQQKYLNIIKDKSLFKKDITLTKDDKILTLSTCSYEFKNARLVVQAKLVQTGDIDEKVKYSTKK
jgi:sortase B